MRSNIWKGALSFGLLNIPISLMKAENTKEETLHFSLLDQNDLSPIQYKKINSKTGKEVPYKRIVKGYEFKKNQYVVMDDKDFKAANIEATGTIDIESFVSLDEIDLMYLEKPYYVVPEKNGEKGYLLLCKALKKSHKAALGKMVLRTKQHLALIIERDNHLVLEMMRFSHEIIKSDEVKYFDELKKSKCSSKEMSMALDLIENMSEPWKPKQYKDTYYDDLKKIITKKINAGKGKTIEYEKPQLVKTSTSNVIDLMPLLKKSLMKVSKTSNKRKKA